MRIRAAIRSRGSVPSDIQVTWIPSHLDDEPEKLVSPELVFHAAGNACADKMAGVGAEWALERALVGELPRTDTWDAISALVR